MRKDIKKINTEYLDSNKEILLNEFIEVAKIAEEHFNYIYYDELQKESEKSNEEIERMLDEIPAAKERFVIACQNLAKYAQTNLCLMEDEKVDRSIATEERIQHDTVEILPYIADFYKEYYFLYKDIYVHFLKCNVIGEINERLYNCLFSQTNDDKNQSKVDWLIEAIESDLNYEIDHFIIDYLSFDKNYDVRNSTDSRVKKYLKLAEQIKAEENLLKKYTDIWVEKMRIISKKYVDLYNELTVFFEETEVALKEQLPIISLSSRYPLDLSYCLFPLLCTRERIDEACYRILELYKNGIVVGSYGLDQDPKYSMQNV